MAILVCVWLLCMLAIGVCLLYMAVSIACWVVSGAWRWMRKR